MNLKLIRYRQTRESTFGIMFVDGTFVCYTLEDQAQTKKLYGETRIPSGRYEIGLRVEGGHHQRYRAMFPEMHEGMLHILDVPEFEHILIHIGNSDDDTAGCVLVGDEALQHGIGKSTIAYKKIYPIIRDGVKAGYCQLRIKDEDLFKGVLV